MAYNLFISYDLIPPGQNYEAVWDAIKSLGPWYRVQYSMFWVHTALNAEQAHARVWAVMDARDRLVVVDATGAVVSPCVPDADLVGINAIWFSQAA